MLTLLHHLVGASFRCVRIVLKPRTNIFYEFGVKGAVSPLELPQEGLGCGVVDVQLMGGLNYVKNYLFDLNLID